MQICSRFSVWGSSAMAQILNANKVFLQGLQFELVFFKDSSSVDAF